MATLQDLRKRRFRTIKLFAEAYGCGATKASEILRGHYHLGLSKDNVKHLASVLGVGFVECADACDETFAELKHYRGDAWKRTARTHKGIWSRWLWEERYVQEGIDIGDWRAYRQRYIHQQEQQSR